MKKGNTVCHNVRLLKWCREYGVIVSWNYLSNVPGEQDEWHQEELDLVPLLAHLQAPWNSGTPIRFDRFSAYFACAADHDLQLSPSRVYRFIYPLDDQQMREQAYFFEDLRQESVNGGREQPIWEQLRVSLGAWREEFYHAEKDGAGLDVLTDRASDTLANLIMTVTEDGVVVDDSRPCAVASRHTLQGLEALAYQACDAGEGEGGVLAYCRERTFPDATGQEIRQALSSLCDKKILALISGRYLSLATEGPCRPYLKL